MSLPPQMHVHAAHDIRCGQRRMVKRGAQGVVVDIHPGWSGVTYTVEFDHRGRKHPKPAVTIVGLTDTDVEPD